MGFSVWAAREMEREPKKKKKKRWGGGEGKEPFLPTSSPLFSYRHFSRGLRLSFFVLWSETVRKSLLRRLYVTSLTTIALPVPLHGHRTYFFPSSRLDWWCKVWVQKRKVDWFYDNQNVLSDKNMQNLPWEPRFLPHRWHSVQNNASFPRKFHVFLNMNRRRWIRSRISWKMMPVDGGIICYREKTICCQCSPATDRFVGRREGGTSSFFRFVPGIYK